DGNERQVHHVGGLVYHVGALVRPPQLLGFLLEFGGEQRGVREQFRGSRSRLGPGGALCDSARQVVEIKPRRPAGAPLAVTEPGASLPHGEAQRIAVAIQVYAHQLLRIARRRALLPQRDRKSTRLNSSHVKISYAVFCLKKK